ncbi:MAG: hypothetical protein N5P05_000979 [Chroococcopsis gigantea SAG 12.99]|jgi:hypothetical protein|nr:DUF2993 domain-containing protein [Chlorogloea purpurea SAG 13.99]MDV2999373.1 hypothetical protein [Chroococcopsis gigantea SAG 12.99]
MEWLTIIVSSFLTLLAPAGLIIDKVLGDVARSQLHKTEVLAVRVDNVPSYQIIDGKVDRIRIGARGIYPIANARIETFELETDPINIDLATLREKNTTISRALRRDASGAFRLVLKERDINTALQSADIKARLQKIVDGLIPKQEGMAVQSYKLEKVQLQFLPDRRFNLQIQAQPFMAENVPTDPLDLTLEVSVKVVNGRSIQLSDPEGKLNGRRLSTRLLKGFTDRFTEELDLQRLEKSGITARILQFRNDEDTLELAGFLRVAKTP